MEFEEFWDKWEPCDWPPIEPSAKTKAEFLSDLKTIYNAGAASKQNEVVDKCIEVVKKAEQDNYKARGWLDCFASDIADDLQKLKEK